MDSGPGDGSGSSNGERGGVTEAAHQGDERTTLLGFLQRQRDLVAWRLEGADDAAVRGVATASGLTVHKVVKHLALVERGWVRHVVAGEVDLDRDAEHWHVPDDATLPALLQAYREESARCDAVLAGRGLDDVTATLGFSLRWVLLHLVEETARHLGHLDLLREQADGVVGEEPVPAPVTAPPASPR